MAQRAVIKEQEEFDALDETRQADYKQAQDGKTWILELEGVEDHPATKGLSNTLERYRKIAPDAKAMKAINDAYEAMKEAWGDLDADETKADLARLAELEDGEGKIDVEARIEAAKALLQKKHEKELTKLTDEKTDLQHQILDRDGVIEHKTVETELEAGLTHIGVLPEYRKAARATILQYHKPTVERVENEETGRISYRGIIKTDTGEVSIADFFERWQTEEEAEGFLPPSGNVGTNSKTADGKKITGKKTNPWSKEHWNLTEQGNILKKNRAVAISMAAAHGITIAPEAA